MKVRKVVMAAALIAATGFNSAYALSRNVQVVRQDDNILITASMKDATSNTNVGVTAYKSDYNLSSLSGYTGDLGDMYLVKQVKSDSEGKVSVSIPASKLPYGDVTVSFSALDTERVEADFKICNLSISGTGRGTVTTESPEKLVEGETVTLSYVPENGYRLAYLKINGNTVLSNVSEPGIYTTSPVSDDMNITYSFVEINNIVIDNIVPLPSYSEYEIRPYLSEADRERLSKKLSVVFSGSAYSKVDNYVRVSAGMILSDNIDELKNSKESCTTVEAKNISENGDYMIMFYGDNGLYGKDFYVQSYAEYKNEQTGETIMVYSDIKEFRLLPFVEKLYMSTVLESLHLNPEGIMPHRLD